MYKTVKMLLRIYNKRIRSPNIAIRASQLIKLWNVYL